MARLRERLELIRGNTCCMYRRDSDHAYWLTRAYGVKTIEEVFLEMGFRTESDFLYFFGQSFIWGNELGSLMFRFPDAFDQDDWTFPTDVLVNWWINVIKRSVNYVGRTL